MASTAAGLPRIDVYTLRLFLAVAEEGSIARAATRESIAFMNSAEKRVRLARTRSSASGLLSARFQPRETASSSLRQRELLSC